MLHCLRTVFIVWRVIVLAALLAWCVGAGAPQAQTLDLAWATSAGSSGEDDGIDIATDESGNSYVLGSFSSAIILGKGEVYETRLERLGQMDMNVFVAKYDRQGHVRWARRIGGMMYFNRPVMRIKVDGHGNSYVIGSFFQTVTFDIGEGQDLTLTSSKAALFVAKYDSTGHLRWARQADGVTFDIGRGMVVDGAGNSYVTGGFNMTATFDTEETQSVILSSGGHAEFVAKYDSAGQLLWIRQIDNAYTSVGLSIAIDGVGNSYVTGNFSQTATFDTGEAQDLTLTSSGRAGFVAKYDSTGHLHWVRQVDNGPSPRITVDEAGNSYITGSFRGILTFAPETILSSYGSSASRNHTSSTVSPGRLELSFI